MSKETLLILNGIDGASGEYDLPPQRPQDLARVARGLPLEAADKQDIQIRRAVDQQSIASFGSLQTTEHFGLVEGKDPKDLSQAGWGVIFPQAMADKDVQTIKEALHPLLQHRKEQAAAQKAHYYKECLGDAVGCQQRLRILHQGLRESRLPLRVA